MEYFNKIHIATSNEDVYIKEGSQIVISNCDYHIENKCLYIEACLDDVNVVIPVQKYEDIKVKTATGNCYIDFKEASISHMSFMSSTGDLYLDSYYDLVSFNSPCGEFHDEKRNKPHKTMITKTQNTYTKQNESSWRNGERYQ